MLLKQEVWTKRIIIGDIQFIAPKVDIYVGKIIVVAERKVLINDDSDCLHAL